MRYAKVLVLGIKIFLLGVIQGGAGPPNVRSTLISRKVLEIES